MIGNYCPNPSFETNTATWAVGTSSGTVAIARVTTDHTSGVACAEVTFNATSAGTFGQIVCGDAVSSAVRVTPGDSVYLRCSLKLVSGSTSAFDITVRAWDPTFTSLVAQTQVVFQNSPVAGTWYDLSFIYTVAAGIGYIEFNSNVAGIPIGTTVVRIDKVQFCLASVAPPYVDGDQSGSHWIGAASNSWTSWDVVMTGMALYPSATTYPGTTVWPGQGTAPIVRAFASFDPVSSSTPAWTDLTSRLRSFSTRRGRNSELTDFDTGTVDAAFDNRDRQLDPLNNPSVRPMNRLRLFAEFSAQVFPIIYAYAERWEQTWDKSGVVDAVATFHGADEFKRLNIGALPGSGTIVSAAADQQIGQILDAATSAARRSLEPPGLTVAGDARNMTGQSPLSEIRSSVGVILPRGVFFVAADGTVVFLNGHGAAVYTVSQASYGDGASSTEFRYADFVSDYSDSFLFNQWTASSTTETATASDAASIAAYGVRANSVSFKNSTPGQAATYASQMVANYKDPMFRVTSIKPLMADGSTALATLALDLQYLITVLRTPPGGGSRITQNTFVQSIELEGRPGVPLVCTLGLSPRG